MGLPDPDSVETAHSELLRRLIADSIQASGGWISFARYMELALYAPGLGYYGAGARKFGAAGDFVTAPEISPLFAATLAPQVEQIMRSSAPHIVEAGPGSGVLAADLLLELERRDALPQRYALLELSGELRERQRTTLNQRAPHLASRLEWLEALPQRFAGCVIANELLDALPVHLVAWRSDGSYERGVVLDQEGRLNWSEQPVAGALAEAARAIPVEPPYVSEIGLAARAWTGAWADILDAGALLLIDYGFPRREYYHPQRSAGTLMCHYRHHAHGDPFYLPGLNDITAHVDFTAIAEAGVNGGLELCGYTSQGQFLLNCGITEVLSRNSPPDGAPYLNLACGARKLLSPAEMGELFKVMALGRGVDTPLIGFRDGDRSHRL